MRQTELRLLALSRELQECRDALRIAVASYETVVAERRARRRRLAVTLVALGTCLAAGLAGASSGGSAVRTPTTAAACAPGPGTITHASFAFKGNAATATYTVAAGCDGDKVTLASYSMLGEPQSTYPQTLFDSVSSTSGGTQSLTVRLPSCYWQLDLVTGDALPGIDASHLFGPRRAISTTGGEAVCSAPVTTTTTTTPTTTGTTTTTTTTPTTTVTSATTPTTTQASTVTSSTSPTTPVTPPPPTTTTTGGAPSTDISVTKVASRTKAIVGQQVVYVVTVTNNGPGAASAVVAVDQIPAEESLVSVSDDACSGIQVVTCNFGSLAVGASRIVTIVTLARTAGTATNDVSVTTSTPETTTTNNRAEVSLPIRGPFIPPALPCTAVRLQHQALVAGRQTVIVATARRSGRPAPGVRITLRGPGVTDVGATDAAGQARFVVRFDGVGVLRVHLVQRAGCARSLVEAPIAGEFRPPQLTG